MHTIFLAIFLWVVVGWFFLDSALVFVLAIGRASPRIPDWRLDLLIGEISWRRHQPEGDRRSYGRHRFSGPPVEGHGRVLSCRDFTGVARIHLWGIPWWHGIPYGRRRFGLATWRA